MNKILPYLEKIKPVMDVVLQFLKKLFSDKKVVRWLLILFIPVLLGFIAVIVSYVHFSPELPSPSQLEQINPRLVTNIYDMNGKIAHEYYVERREWVSFDSIPADVYHAVMAIEDREFFNHWGMNVWAIPSAILESVTSGKKMRGASTLTQ